MTYNSTPYAWHQSSCMKSRAVSKYIIEIIQLREKILLTFFGSKNHNDNTNLRTIHWNSVRQTYKYKYDNEIRLKTEREVFFLDFPSKSNINPKWNLSNLPQILDFWGSRAAARRRGLLLLHIVRAPPGFAARPSIPFSHWSALNPRSP